MSEKIRQRPRGKDARNQIRDLQGFGELRDELIAKQSQQKIETQPEEPRPHALSAAATNEPKQTIELDADQVIRDTLSAVAEEKPKKRTASEKNPKRWRRAENTMRETTEGEWKSMLEQAESRGPDQEVVSSEKSKTRLERIVENMRQPAQEGVRSNSEKRDAISEAAYEGRDFTELAEKTQRKKDEKRRRNMYARKESEVVAPAPAAPEAAKEPTPSDYKIDEFRDVARALQRSMRRRAELQAQFDGKETALRDAETKFAGWEGRLKDIGADEPATERKGLRRSHSIPEKGYRALDTELAVLQANIDRTRSERDAWQKKLDAAMAAEAPYKMRYDEIRAAARQKMNNLGEERTATLKTLMRFQGVAHKAQKDLDDHTKQLETATDSSSRTVLKNWVRKDKLMLDRVKSGAGGKYLGIAGWERRIKEIDARILREKATVESTTSPVETLETLQKKPEHIVNAVDPSNEAPPQTPPTPPLTPEGHAAQQEQAKTYADLWNSRFRSKGPINAHELAELFPTDRHASVSEIGAIMESYLKNRPRGIWKFPGMTWVYKKLVEQRVKSLRAWMQLEERRK